MKILLLGAFSLVLLSCNNSDKPEETPVQEPVQAPVPPPVPEDSVVTKLRPVLLAIETKELQTDGTIQNISLGNIHYEMVSMKDFYQVRKDELQKQMAISSDKEKTTKAIHYLDGLITRAGTEKNVYKTVFHLNALLSNTISYNEDHTKYLKKDLTEIRIIFP